MKRKILAVLLAASMLGTFLVYFIVFTDTKRILPKEGG